MEAALAAVKGDQAALAAESADLVYHWLVVLAAAGVSLDDVAARLEARGGTLGDRGKGVAASARLQAPTAPRFRRHVERALAAVAAVRSPIRPATWVRGSAARPSQSGDAAAQHAVAADALAGDHQHRAPALATERATKRVERGAGGVLGQAVQVDPRRERLAAAGDAPVAEVRPPRPVAAGRAPCRMRASARSAAWSEERLRHRARGRRGKGSRRSRRLGMGRSQRPHGGRDHRPQPQVLDVGQRLHGALRRRRAGRGAAHGAPCPPPRRPPRPGRDRGRRAPRP